MRRTLAAAIILIGVVVPARPALSQEPVPAGPPLALAPAVIGEGLVSLGTRATLAEIPAIQAELRMTQAQRARIAEIRQANARAEMTAFQQFQERSSALGPQPAPNAAGPISRQFQDELNSLGRRFEESAMKVLDARQRVRLEQIHLQAEGPLAFLRRDVRERLRLTPDQVKTIRALIARSRQELAAIPAVPAGVPQIAGPITAEQARALEESKPYQDAIRKSRETARNARSSTQRAITKLLSQEQQTDYQAMLGESFDFARLRGNRNGPPR